jgi:serine/threonine protein kinase
MTAPTVAPSDGEPCCEDRPPLETPLTRYRPLRFHAKGALGEVYVARDQECHRDVALKTIQAEWASDEVNRQRFEREAEITARLEHPSIVPVYGMAIGADGRPCYAMRFISGETLNDAVQRYHAIGQSEGETYSRGPLRWLRQRLSATERANHTEAERALVRRQLLAHFIAVCNAVAYAHSRGIIHRDLKPQNIMLGKYGETLVVDWGLARVFTRSPAERATGEESLVPSTNRPPEMTQVGQIVGTPAYMSPEQAAGRIGALGPASDIYSLGATLYVLLTGQPPICEPNIPLLLAKVQAGEIPPPREVKRTVSPGLDAICKKAMALRPEDRYATAQDLASDIARWLADEKVTAWREPFGERFQRLTRKHAKFVAGMTATLSLLYPLAILAPQYLALNNNTRNPTYDSALYTQRLTSEADARELQQLRNERHEAVMKKLEESIKLSRFTARLTMISLAYSNASQKLGRPPRKEEELAPFVEKEEYRISPRDGKPFAIAWGVDNNPPNQPLLAWEETPDEEGRRWVFQGGARLVDRCDFRDLKGVIPVPPVRPTEGIPVPKRLIGPGFMPIGLIRQLEPTEVSGYGAEVGWATSEDGKKVQVIVKLSKPGKTFDLPDKQLQVRLLSDGNKPLNLTKRFPAPEKPAAEELPHIVLVSDNKANFTYVFWFDRTGPGEKLEAMELSIKGKQKRLPIPPP